MSLSSSRSSDARVRGQRSVASLARADACVRVVERAAVLLTLLVGLFGFAAAGCGGSSSLVTDDAGPGDAGSDATTSQVLDGASDALPGDEGPAAGDAGGADGEGGPAAALASIAITPPLSTLAAGTNVALRATGTFSDGSTLDLTPTVTWTTDAAAVATVVGGAVTAVAPGVAHIQASLDGIRGTATVTVSAATIASLAVTPSAASIGVSGTQAFTATATLSDGSHQDLTSTVTWSASPQTVASISPTGVATGVGGGTATIKALLVAPGIDGGSLSATASLTVTGAALASIAISPTNPVVGTNVTFPFTATATYADSSIADVTASATWSSSSPSTLAIASGGAGAGTATSLSAGTSIVTAAVGAISATTTVTVTSATLASIAVTPASSTIALGGTASLKATGTYSDGSTADLTASVTWSSNPSGVASVSNAAGSQGLVTGLTGGTATVTATLGAARGSASVTVTPATLTSIAITPANPAIPIGTTLALIAKGTYSDNSVVDLTASVTWSTASPAVATISNAAGTNGVVSAIGVGGTAVTAALGLVSAKTTLTVTAATLTSLAVTPVNPALVVGQKLSLVATGTYSDNTTIDLTAKVVWTTSSAAIVGVSNASGAQGQITAVSVGSSKISATLGAIVGSTTVTVTAPALAQLVVSPALPSRAIGQRLQFAATAIFTNNTSQNVTAQATWTSATPATATLNATGLATALAVGTTTITASYQGLTGATTLTVTGAVVVTSIVVTPIGATLAAGTRQAYAATAIMSDNSTQNVTRNATWTSASPTVATVTPGGGGGGGGGGVGGTVVALAAGATTIRATYQGVTGSTPLTVTSAVVVGISITPAVATTAVGDKVQYAASAIYSDNSSRDVTATATWQSTKTTVAQIGTAGGGRGGGGGATTPGLATGIGAGSTTIEATFSGVTGMVTLTVTTATVASIEITPAAPTLPQNLPVALRATAIFTDNTSQDVTALATWTSNATAVLGVSDTAGSKGSAVTLAAGTATVSASWSGVTGRDVVRVTSATLASIQVTPFAPTLPVGYETQLAATGIYSDNTTIDLTPYATWTSSVPATAAVSSSGATRGAVSPLQAGTTSIGATYGGVTGSDALTVSNATLVSIGVTPGTATIAVQATEAFTATGTFSDASKMNVTSYVTWLSPTPAVASVSNAAGTHGVATGLSPGSVTITAVRGSVSATASLTVK